MPEQSPVCAKPKSEGGSGYQPLPKSITLNHLAVGRCGNAQGLPARRAMGCVRWLWANICCNKYPGEAILKADTWNAPAIPARFFPRVLPGPGAGN